MLLGDNSYGKACSAQILCLANGCNDIVQNYWEGTSTLTRATSELSLDSSETIARNVQHGAPIVD